jgi:hypothetical protein
MITNDGQDLTQARRVCATGSIMALCGCERHDHERIHARFADPA